MPQHSGRPSFLLLVILVQAGAYWLAARSWGGTLADAPCLGRHLPGVPGGGCGDAGDWSPWGDRLVARLRRHNAGCAPAIWTFGVIEYVNYFVVRLAYPIGRWHRTAGQWRTPRLVQDLRGAATRAVIERQRAGSSCEFVATVGQIGVSALLPASAIARS